MNIKTLCLQPSNAKRKVPAAVTRRFSGKSVLKNFTKFTEKYLRQSLLYNKVAGAKLTGKHLGQSLFNKVADFRLQTWLWHRCFPVNLAPAKFLSKSFQNSFFIEHLRWLLLKFKPFSAPLGNALKSLLGL